MTEDILIDWHPTWIAKLIRDAIGKRQQKDAAKVLGITPQYLCDILQARRGLSPEVAAKLGRIGLPGRHLYTMQEKRRVEIQWRYETGETDRPNVSRETPEKPLKSKKSKPLSALAYRKRSIKGWDTRKRQALARQCATQGNAQ